MGSYLKSRFFKKIYRKIIVAKILWKNNGNFWKIKCMLDGPNEEHKRHKYLMAYYELMRKNGSMIGNKAQFAKEPYFPHGMLGIFVSDGAKIGDNCTIFQHVTIGSNLLLDSKGKGAPTIGNNCYIGAGAKIIGNVKIGNNCRIGANCVVYRDMPDNSVAVLQPTRVIQKKELDNTSQLSLRNL
jgi:serine O-acetyltransferase